ncbi:hypothetical protein CEXT_615831 [Caerostris extrusa]|uniref:Uncharacterized protein n=1 Tax=Caerostris extrusa TaxID=172846 RepID=A0AAV4SMA4_CAEEX|nr:hypothetical protein CEXT_615831 [Caerostris extrusa]
MRSSGMEVIARLPHPTRLRNSGLGPGAEVRYISRGLIHSPDLSPRKDDNRKDTEDKGKGNSLYFSLPVCLPAPSRRQKAGRFDPRSEGLSSGESNNKDDIPPSDRRSRAFPLSSRLANVITAREECARVPAATKG